MKKNEKLLFKIEEIWFVSRFDEIDPKLRELALKLEKEGNLYGHVVGIIDDACVTVNYADGSCRKGKNNS